MTSYDAFRALGFSAADCFRMTDSLGRLYYVDFGQGSARDKF